MISGDMSSANARQVSPVQSVVAPSDTVLAADRPRLHTCQVVSTSTQYVNAAPSLLGLAEGTLVWLWYWRQFSPQCLHSHQPKGHTCSRHTICSAAHLVADWGCARVLGHLLLRPTALREI